MSEPEKQTVLIVDDDPELLQLLQTELRQEFHVLSASSGEEGLVTTLLHKPDILISDINMPDLNGWELCYILRHIPSVRTIPIVFLSNRSELPDRIKSLRLGADDFIAKPFSMEQVIGRLRAILGRMKNRQQLVAGHSVELEINSLLIDLLEYLRATRRSGVIEFSRIDQSGHVTLHKGILTEAQFEETRGKTALRRMLQVDSGEISFREKNTENGKPLIPDWTGFIASFLPPES